MAHLLSRANLKDLRPVVCRPRLHTRACRSATYCSAAPPQPPLPTKQNTSSNRVSVINLIAASIEANARVAVFEKFAGRSAMIGFSVALVVELFSGNQGLFGGLGTDEGNMFVTVALLCVSMSAALAASSTRQLGRRFTEAVLTSLTAVQRSKGSVSMRNVDKAVDFVLDDVFFNRLLTKHVRDEDNKLV